MPRQNRRQNSVAHKLEFVSYSGKFPTLCMGLLVLRLNGRILYGFSPLISGGDAGVDFYDTDDDDDPGFEEYCYSGEWSVDFNKTFSFSPPIQDESGMEEADNPLPESWFSAELKKKITSMVNKKVPWGCCGGCI